MSLYSGETLLAYTVTTPPVHSYNTQPLSHYTPITQQYPSTQLEYTVTIPPVHS
ncbi:hypothetical protein NP493_2881g00000 [Ridgeia piscesae]|uniref:Uncharacterized protein n=1 Tax=Ridgeia piscesae TaxID=27915 RepID=A0AAD9JCA5_RIDPI|nr:hypothetical protein NP493_2881g00000 [Ridgeia piscesae]